ncbi:methyltransferase domain-containing protein [Thermodesulfobacteriota bacterium]
MDAKTHVTSRPINKCQICGSHELSNALFLGYIPPVNTMPEVGSVPVEQAAYPLSLLRCDNCTLVQISLEVDADVLFPYSYPYLSGSTRILKENFADLYKECSGVIRIGSDDMIVDIGSNDGTLLSNFKDSGHRVLGVEPSQAGEVARKNGIETITAYFNRETAKSVREKYGQAKIITAANVFAHIGNIDTVVEGILELLEPEGVFISESHYLLSLIETLQYDTIYHEHLRYYSVESLRFLLNKHGLDIFHVKKIPTHGGSIRVYAARKGQFPIRESVAEFLAEEKVKGLTDGNALTTFRKQVLRSKLELMALLKNISETGTRVFGIGAPSRSSTLINYTGIDDGIIEAVMEIKTSPKVGKYVPGTRIPVLDEALLFEEQPEYALLLSWHISDELIKNLRRKGYRGKFIIPLPEPRIFEG